jgi:nucleoside-diphosphate-sugar epimerase
MKNQTSERVLITGGAGYVGSELVPLLLSHGYEVVVLDLFIYGKEPLDRVKNHPNLTLIEGDIRNVATVKQAVNGCDHLIHLACISNDPSFELDPDLGKSINFDAFEPLVDAAIDAGVGRFIYASSSSVYGIKDELNVTEDLSLEPLTGYSKYKAACEEILQRKKQEGFAVLTIRPATVCGYAPRLRLDLSVNILTNHAVNNGKIKVFGGSQLRPNVHIKDMVNLYLKTLQLPPEKINGKVYNFGYENHSILDIAQMVQDVIGQEIPIEIVPTDDLRSYHISSEKIERELGIIPEHTLKEAIADLVEAFHGGLIPNPMGDPKYYNIKMMSLVGVV